MKTFNKRYKELMEDMGTAGAVGGSMTTSTVFGPGQAHPTNVGQSSDFYATGDARNIWGVGPKKKKSKFKAPKNNPGFKSKFKVIRRTPPGL